MSYNVFLGGKAMWEDAVQGFLKGYSGITHRRYQDALRDFADWYRATYGEAPNPQLLTAQEIREYTGYLLSVRRLKAASVNLRLSALRSLLRHIGREVRVRGVRQEKPPVDALEGRELGRLFAALEGDDWLSRRNQAMVALMARAGLRVGEVLALMPEDVEVNARSGWVLVRKGKGVKERRVPLSAEARQALRAYLEVRPQRPGRLFFSRTFQPLTGRDVQRIIAEAARRAGLGRRVTPHTLRHTFATRFLRAGGDLATLQAILGHANLSTTARYLHPDAGRMQEMVEEL
ncbi:MAG: tyrosine-type recombinase/integrase [Gloeomargarita sp. SKYB31]|nr:tyrosine-type recombinase/integrase [Gloeomargarita sp. SKYB31]